MAIRVRSSGAFSPALTGASARPRRTRIFICASYLAPDERINRAPASTSAATQTKTLRRRNITCATSRTVGEGAGVVPSGSN